MAYHVSSFTNHEEGRHIPSIEFDYTQGVWGYQVDSTGSREVQHLRPDDEPGAGGERREVGVDHETHERHNWPVAGERAGRAGCAGRAGRVGRVAAREAGGR